MNETGAEQDYVNEGADFEKVKSWVDVEGFVEEDEIIYSDTGTLLIT